MIDWRQNALFAYWSAFIMAHISLVLVALGWNLFGGLLLGFWVIVTIMAGIKIEKHYGGFRL